MNNSCVSCNTPLKGKFCYSCGEKVVENNDFSIQNLLHQFINGITNFDSKFLKSFYYLLFKPGQLTLNYVNGRRVSFMKPFQVFIVVNILFFFFLADADVFRIPAKWYFNKEVNIEKKITDSKNVELIKQQYDNESLTNSKLFIFILIPFFGIIFWMANLKKKLYFGKHIIFAIHYLSFFMLFSVCLVITPKEIWTPRAIQAVLLISNFIYLFFAIRKFYNNTNKVAFIKALLCVFICFTLIFFYRDLISYYTYKMVIKEYI